MPKKKRDAEATKSKILYEAMQLFSQKGFDATTVDDIAKACDINKAMVYYYYQSKAGLYEELMSVLMQNIYDDIFKAYQKSTNAIEGLKAFVLTYGQYAKRHPYFPALLLRELSNSGAYLPEKMFSKMRNIFALLSEILQKGEQEGIFHNVMPMMVHFMIIGTINLMVTTTPLRQIAQEYKDVDTCARCSTEEISEYVFEKIKRMLEEG